MGDDNSEQGLMQFLNNTVNHNYAFAAMTTLLLYDIAYTFVDEVKYIWRGMKWSITKVLYLIARYYCASYLLIESLSPSGHNISTGFATIPTCNAFTWYHGLGGVAILTTVVDLIFSYRVSALYGNSKRVILFLAVGLVVQLAAALTMSILLAIVQTDNALVLADLECVSNKTTRIESLLPLQSIAFGITLAYNTALFLLTATKAGIGYVRDNGGWKNILRRPKDTFSPILVSIVRDGTIYFCINFLSTAILTATATNTRASISNVSQYLFPGHIAILSCLGSRLILTLRRLCDHNMNEQTPNLSRSIFFAQPRASMNRSNEGSNNEYI